MMVRKEHEVQFVATSKIIPTRDNPRRVNVKCPEFLELLASVKARGIMVPMIGRWDPKREGMIDLRAGARRFAAAVEAGLTEVPVIVFEMDDEEAMEITVLENLQREDLTPMEEARGIARLRSVNKSDGDIGDKLGKSAAWVRRRAQLLNLRPEIAEAWEAGEDYRVQAASVASMEFLASFDHVIQAQIFKAAGHSEFRDAAEFKQEIRKRYLNLLSAAPWDLADHTIDEKAGSCNLCRKRSSQEALLFHDVLDAEEVTKCDQCLDAVCFAGKLKAHLARAEAEVRKLHPNVVRVAMKEPYSMEWDEQQELQKNGVRFKGDFQKVKERTPGAVPAVVVAGPGTGDTIWILAGRSGPAEGGQAQETKAGPKTLEQKRMVLEGRRLVLAIRKVSESLEASLHPAGESTVGMLARLVTVFGVRMPHVVFEGLGYDADEWPDLKRETKIDDFDVVKRLWAMLKPVLQGFLSVQAWPGHIGEHADEYAAKAAGVCSLIGKDWKKTKAGADEEIAEPKGWAAATSSTTKDTKPEQDQEPKVESATGAKPRVQKRKMSVKARARTKGKKTRKGGKSR